MLESWGLVRNGEACVVLIISPNTPYDFSSPGDRRRNEMMEPLGEYYDCQGAQSNPPALTLSRVNLVGQCLNQSPFRTTVKVIKRQSFLTSQQPI
jgi:hypothetical protein